jgi:predicted HicB family RNase H-like nuclease
MKSTVLKYKSYEGSVQVSTDGDFLFGKIVGISDVVTYEASTYNKLNNAFRAAVEDYLRTCKSLGKDTEKKLN